MTVDFNPEKPYRLPVLPPSFDFRNPDFLELAALARTDLGELKGYSSGMPNPMLLLSPAIIKESVASSNIENINTTVENVFQQSLFPELERSEDDKEVLRYRDAILNGISQMKELPISRRLIEIVHKSLLKGKNPGVRKNQNQIANLSTGKIIYTPPDPREVSNLLTNLEEFIHADDRIDSLIKCAIVHYQFEAIHPFLDGNGRTGRILMVLYLVSQGLLNYPILYISGYINKHKDKYYDGLLNVTRHGDWNAYILFMLEAFRSQAKETKEVLFKIMELFLIYKDDIQQKLPRIYRADLVEHMFAMPILSPVALGDRLKVHYSTASRYLEKLQGAGFLQDIKYGKYHLFINMKLMAIISDN